MPSLADLDGSRSRAGLTGVPADIVVAAESVPGCTRGISLRHWVPHQRPPNSWALTADGRLTRYLRGLSGPMGPQRKHTRCEGGGGCKAASHLQPAHLFTLSDGHWGAHCPYKFSMRRHGDTLKHPTLFQPRLNSLAVILVERSLGDGWVGAEGLVSRSWTHSSNPEARLQTDRQT